MSAPGVSTGATDAAAEPTVIGNHAIRMEPPDLICIAPQGDVTEEDMRALNEHLLEASKGLPHVLVLADLSSMMEIDRDARKFRLTARNPPFRGMAFYGASFTARIVAKLVLGAARWLGKMGENPICFFATEPEARAWIDERRRALAHKQAQ